MKVVIKKFLSKFFIIKENILNTGPIQSLDIKDFNFSYY